MVLVIKSPAQKSPGAPGTARSGVKVMLRKKRIITTTPSKPPPTSIPGSLEQVSPNVVNFTIVYDKTGRAFEEREQDIKDMRTRDADFTVAH
nr:unnamed protein product [Haemonchus contortus]